MYNSKLVCCVKANGKILREFKDTVLIPFGTEYEFLIKNLHTTRAVVNIFIDGDNVVEGGLVIEAGQEVALERYIKNGNLTEGNRFKFIERTNSIEQHRGVKVEDGLVRIEFQFEKVLPTYQKTSSLFYPPGVRGWSDFRIGDINGSIATGEYKGVTDKFTLAASGAVLQANVGGALRGIDTSQNGQATAATASAAVDQYLAANNIRTNDCHMHDGQATMDYAPLNDAGITVPGSKSTQRFQATTLGQLEAEKHSIVLKLVGETADNKPVTAPVTVKTTQKCSTCGRVNKATSKYCVECGTALTIYA